MDQRRLSTRLTPAPTTIKAILVCDHAPIANAMTATGIADLVSRLLVAIQNIVSNSNPTTAAMTPRRTAMIHGKIRQDRVRVRECDHEQH